MLVGCLFAVFAGAEAQPTAVPLADVDIRSDFWTPWIELNRKVIIPHNFTMYGRTGVLDNFAKAAGAMKGDFIGFPNSDEVPYKAVEAASYALQQRYDAALDKQLDSVIGKIAAAQEKDGYICTPGTIGLGGAVVGRFSKRRPVHELYLFGHLYEAAVAHYRATGKRGLIEVAVRNAEFVDHLFGPDKIRDVPQHPEIELALVKLYEATGERRYLALAKFFVDERGYARGRTLFGQFAQDHVPILQQTEAVGQAPRATYLFSGAADAARLTGDARYLPALRRLWENVVFKKLYVTGGIGSRHENEGFGQEYDLPNKSAYAETCAAVSFSMWNHRMFPLDPDAGYFDVLERTIYNNLLAGVSLSGDRFFYANPIEANGLYRFNRGWVPRGATGPHTEGEATRREWFYCPCCPPNIARQISSIASHIYYTSADTVYVNLFVAGSARMKVDRSGLRLVQETRYPWEGRIGVTVHPERPARFRVAVRIPSWAQGRPVPGDLYRYSGASTGKPSVRVNGIRADPHMERGFAVIDREWRRGDTVELVLPMPVRRVLSHENVKDNAGRVALERGPIVYCAEGVDNGGRALNLVLPDDSKIVAEFRKDLLHGVMVLTGEALAVEGAAQPKKQPFVAIPYYAWSNRGAGEMAVWLWRNAESARTAPRL